MTSKTWYAEVAPAIPLPVTSAETYTYIVPQPVVDQVRLYMPVTIPFGRRTVPGVIMRLHQDPVPYQTKPLKIAAPITLTETQVQFGQWIAHTMQGGLGYTLRLFFPSFPKKGWLPDQEKSTKKENRETEQVAIIEPDFKKRSALILERVTKAIKQKQSAVIIVPEIWMLEVWRKTLPKKLLSKTAIVHAGLKPAELREIWQRTKAGEYDLIIGTQKALFLPFSQLGLVVIDEEYLPTHKLWDQYPRLDNRLGTAVLARAHHASYVSTGSINSLQQSYQAPQLPITHEHLVPLTARVISSTFEDRTQKHLLPDELINQLKQWLQKKQRVLFLHNARGGWQTLYCRNCEQPVRCPNCQVALTLHNEGKREYLECHHCGYTQSKVPKVCPHCGKPKLTVFGAGVEKVTEILAQVLPKKVTITNLDATTEEIEVGQVTVATSAVFARVPNERFDQAVYLWPERGLLYPDFRSEERMMYQLLRLQQLLPAKKKVTLVTRQPKLVQQSLLIPYELWQTRQLKERQRLQYPPITDLVRLSVQDKDEDRARAKAIIIRQQLEERQSQQNIAATIRGPFSSFVKRRRGFAEVHLLLTGPLSDLIKIYSGLAVDVVDVYPERIL